MRRYMAKAVNGRDYITFEFYSKHKANSKPNIKNAEFEYKCKHGHYVRVISTWLVKGE